LVAGLTFVGIAGCSSTHRIRSTPSIGPAAEPSVAPSLRETPAGRIITLAAGSAPEGVAVDPKTQLVIVALRNPDRIALIDERTFRVRYQPTDGRARHLTLATPGGPVLLPAEDTNQLLEIALPSGQTAGFTILPRNPHNAAVIGGNYWVDDELAPAVSVVSPSGRILATLHGPVQPGGVAAAAGQVGVTDVRGARLYFYNEATFQAEGSIPIGAGPTHDASVGGNHILVADTRGGALLLVDMTERKVISRLTLPGAPYGLTADPATGDVWVTLTATNQLIQLSVKGTTLRILQRIPTVQQPNTLGFDPISHCVYVAGVTHAQLQVICPAKPG
jgi:DNA-binding beta-propeller fold protein YncE